nr:MAG TPA: hypothetical protein [Caudoviricetes sp.]
MRFFFLFDIRYRPSERYLTHIRVAFLYLLSYFA